MRFGLAAAQDVDDVMAGGFEPVSDQAAMTLPPERFSAEDGGAFLRGECEQALHSRVKGRGVHVIGITAKGGVAPSGVARIHAGCPASAKIRKMQVIDAGLRERLGELLLAELRMAPRPGITANVCQRADVVGVQQFKKFAAAPGGMSNRPDFHGLICSIQYAHRREIVQHRAFDFLAL